MQITKEGLDAVDLEALRPFARDSVEFYGRPGREHYRLLAYLSTLVPNGSEIFDIGTLRGNSAIALSYNPHNTVHSFDIVDAVPAVKRMRRNVAFHCQDLFDSSVRGQWGARILASPLILLDIDPHEGMREFEFVSWLERERYSGLLVLDDIWYFEPMRRNLWYRIPARYRADATPVGHWSGTGFVSFGALPTGHGVELCAPTDGWTLVTGYFDLTAKDDANDAIRARPAEHYLDQHARGTLAIPENLVVFTEKAHEAKIWELRPRDLHGRTKVIVQEFEDFPLSKFLPDILRARNGGACAQDPRNTASYYLFCVARFAMLRKAIEEQPFGSDRFAWINICIERMGFKNLARMKSALSVRREKFSTAHIAYKPKSLLDDLPAYFGRNGCRDPQSSCGGCSMASGFFTGSDRYMTEAIDLVEAKFAECLAVGYGHADEQLIALAHRSRPELFDWYLADYAQMVTNYAGLVENAESSVRNLIRPSFEARDWAMCLKASGLLWSAYRDGKCDLSDVDLSFLLAAMKIADANAPTR